MTGIVWVGNGYNSGLLKQNVPDWESRSEVQLLPEGREDYSWDIYTATVCLSAKRFGVVRNLGVISLIYRPHAPPSSGSGHSTDIRRACEELRR